MLRRGFTLIELLIAITVAGIMLGIGLPRLRGAMIQESVRSARREVTTRLANARAVAVQRGCPATLRMNAAATQVWVTTCRTGGAVGIDTIGTVANLGTRYQVAMAASSNAVVFGPHGIATGAGWVALKFARSGHTDSLAISPVGRAAW
jgi:prepilin-type N-terminal cleavage/methylation domain-containing protein